MRNLKQEIALENDTQPEKAEGSFSAKDIDLERLAEKVYEILLREIEIENERLGLSG